MLVLLAVIIKTHDFRGSKTTLNYELIAAVVQHICVQNQPGAVLIFLPGLAEIKRCLQTIADSCDTAQYPLVLLPLHSTLSPQEQQRIFEPAPGRSRKIIAATNIAETSITVEDVVFVVDVGLMKQTQVIRLKNRILPANPFAFWAAV
jgi:HrpA-like RNA helicase